MRISIIGAGVVGLSVTKALLDSGEHEVRCYEATRPMSERSSGDGRIFRVAHQDEYLVDLALHARRSWQAWSFEAGVKFLHTRGQFLDVKDAEDQTALMLNAGAPAEIVMGTEAFKPLTSHRMDEALLYDPSAGVLDAVEIGRFLVSRASDALIGEPVVAIETTPTPIIRSKSEAWPCDSILIAAGRNTAALAATADLRLPVRHEHVFRHTFRIKEASAVVPNWCDRYGPWTTWVFAQDLACGPWEFTGSKSRPA